MKNMLALSAGVVAAFVFRSAIAEPAQPVAVELFTSQGCYSCPPAEVYLGELAKRPDVVALEWHVDYWDDLVYGSAGQWKDPFSSPAATARQYAYNASITGRARAYTPQMIVGGRSEAVGSSRSRVESAIRKLRGKEPAVRLSVKKADDGGISVSAKGESLTLWRVEFLKSHVTKVLRGENKGKTLESHNIVKSKTRLGRVGDGMFSGPAPAAGDGCAILAQVGETGPVLAAAYCPGSGPDRPA